MRYEIFPDNNTSLLNINIIGFSGDTNVTRFGPGQRNLYIIHYVTKGKGYYNGNPVAEGQGFLIYPGQKEEYYPSESDPWEFLWIVSTDDSMKEIFNRYNVNTDTMIFDYDSVPVVRKIANTIMTESNKILDSLKMLEMYLHILNSHTYTQISTRCKTNCEIYLEFCVDFIETNMLITEIANSVGYNDVLSFSKAFSSKEKVSPQKYRLLTRKTL